MRALSRDSGFAFGFCTRAAAIRRRGVRFEVYRATCLIVLVISNLVHKLYFVTLLCYFFRDPFFKLKRKRNRYVVPLCVISLGIHSSN